MYLDHDDHSVKEMPGSPVSLKMHQVAAMARSAVTMLNTSSMLYCSISLSNVFMVVLVSYSQGLSCFQT